MPDRLFVYGSLAPGRTNEHLLAGVRGTWAPASVRGTLRQEGWGIAIGYPAIVLDPSGEEVQGLIFTSNELAAHWSRLDAFEGEDYQRVFTSVKLEDGTVVQAYIYALSGSSDGPSDSG